MPRGRPKGIPKTGGRKKGTKNLPPPIVVTPEELAKDRALAIVAPAELKTPKAVMLSAMMKFDRLSDMMLTEASRMGDGEGRAETIAAAHRFTIAAVQCAEKVAPYIHARLIAMESREGAEERVPYVIRAPAVMADSSAWQAAVGAAVVDMEASQAVQAPLAGPAASAAPVASSAPAALVLGPDAKSGRITVMPAGPRVVQPAGTEEWLAEVDRERRRRANGG